MWIIITIVILFGGFILYISLEDYLPDKVEILYEANENQEPSSLAQESFSLISWNIGYAGLGAEMDFFYDGGKKVRPEKEQNQKYFEGIKSFIKAKDVDFFLLQEVDVRSHRSYNINQVEAISKLISDHHSVFALNYKVPFVPVPVTQPMGKVKGGLMIFSKEQPVYSERVAYPLIASWPDRLFLLDRCFILSRYELDNGKELVVINTHNSAYVYDTSLRNQEFNIIRRIMIEEYRMGNYVVAGGDWNSNPPHFKPEGDYNGHKFRPAKVVMDPSFLPDDWQWAFGDAAPTNRDNDNAYVKGRNGTTVLDYFVASPNIEILDVRTIDLDFVSSDHNPVSLNIRVIK